jgi:uncharacterized membrane protein
MSAFASHPARKLRRSFFQGLAVIGPLGVTAFVLVWLFREADGILGEYLYPAIGRSIPGLGILVLCALLVLTGWLAQKAVGARLVSRWDDFLRRVPVARRIYSGSSRIVRTVLGEERFAFREVVLFEYPGPGLLSVGFISGPASSSAEERFGEPSVTVYLPTAPNPMSGYLVQLPRSRLQKLDVTPEEAFTYVISAGAVSVDQAADVLARAD